MDTLGSRIRELREKSNLRQGQLAYEVDCAASAISNYENDRREPSVSDLDKISDALKPYIGDYRYYLHTGENIQDHVHSNAYGSQYVKKSDAVETVGNLIRELVKIKAMRINPDVEVREILKRLSILLGQVDSQDDEHIKDKVNSIVF